MWFSNMCKEVKRLYIQVAKKKISKVKILEQDQSIMFDAII